MLWSDLKWFIHILGLHYEIIQLPQKQFGKSSLHLLKTTKGNILPNAEELSAISFCTSVAFVE